MVENTLNKIIKKKEQKLNKLKKITSIEGDIISKLVNLIYILDYVSIYLAIINKVDPTPVNSIDYIKKRL